MFHICLKFNSQIFLFFYFIFLFFFQTHPVDLCRNVTGAVTVVDIYGCDSVRARIDHCKQCGDSVHAGAIANRGRNSDHRFVHQTAQYTCQRTFHTCHCDHTVRILDRIQSGKETVDPCHTDIINPLYF